eukprot:jgi/Botrbrau1/1251/Bobra.0163s0044.1
MAPKTQPFCSIEKNPAFNNFKRRRVEESGINKLSNATNATQNGRVSNAVLSPGVPEQTFRTAQNNKPTGERPSSASSAQSVEGMPRWQQIVQSQLAGKTASSGVDESVTQSSSIPLPSPPTKKSLREKVQAITPCSKPIPSAHGGSEKVDKSEFSSTRNTRLSVNPFSVQGVLRATFRAPSIINATWASDNETMGGASKEKAAVFSFAVPSAGGRSPQRMVQPGNALAMSPKQREEEARPSAEGLSVPAGRESCDTGVKADSQKRGIEYTKANTNCNEHASRVDHEAAGDGRGRRKTRRSTSAVRSYSRERSRLRMHSPREQRPGLDQSRSSNLSRRDHRVWDSQHPGGYVEVRDGRQYERSQPGHQWRGVDRQDRSKERMLNSRHGALDLGHSPGQGRWSHGQYYEAEHGREPWSQSRDNPRAGDSRQWGSRWQKRTHSPGNISIGGRSPTRKSRDLANRKSTDGSEPPLRPRQPLDGRHLETTDNQHSNHGNHRQPSWVTGVSHARQPPDRIPGSQGGCSPPRAPSPSKETRASAVDEHSAKQQARLRAWIQAKKNLPKVHAMSGFPAPGGVNHTSTSLTWSLDKPAPSLTGGKAPSEELRPSVLVLSAMPGLASPGSLQEQGSLRTDQNRRMTGPTSQHPVGPILQTPDATGQALPCPSSGRGVSGQSKVGQAALKPSPVSATPPHGYPDWLANYGSSSICTSSTEAASGEPADVARTPASRQVSPRAQEQVPVASPPQGDGPDGSRLSNRPSGADLQTSVRKEAANSGVSPSARPVHGGTRQQESKQATFSPYGECPSLRELEARDLGPQRSASPQTVGPAAVSSSQNRSQNPAQPEQGVPRPGRQTLSSETHPPPKHPMAVRSAMVNPVIAEPWRVSLETVPVPNASSQCFNPVSAHPLLEPCSHKYSGPPLGFQTAPQGPWPSPPDRWNVAGGVSRRPVTSPPPLRSPQGHPWHLLPATTPSPPRPPHGYVLKTAGPPVGTAGGLEQPSGHVGASSAGQAAPEKRQAELTADHGEKPLEKRHRPGNSRWDREVQSGPVGGAPGSRGTHGGEARGARGGEARGAHQGAHAGSREGAHEAPGGEARGTHQGAHAGSGGGAHDAPGGEAWGAHQGAHAGPGGEDRSPEGGEAPGSKGGETSGPDGGEAPGPEGGEAPGPEGGQAPGPEGGEAPGPEGGKAPGREGGEAPGPDGGGAPGSEGGEAPGPKGGQAPGPEGGKAPGAHGQAHGGFPVEPKKASNITGSLVKVATPKTKQLGSSLGRRSSQGRGTGYKSNQPTICPVCNMVVSQKRNLTRHEKSAIHIELTEELKMESGQRLESSVPRTSSNPDLSSSPGIACTQQGAKAAGSRRPSATSAGKAAGASRPPAGKRKAQSDPGPVKKGSEGVVCSKKAASEQAAGVERVAGGDVAGNGPERVPAPAWPGPARGSAAGRTWPRPGSARSDGQPCRIGSLKDLVVTAPTVGGPPVPLAPPIEGAPALQKGSQHGQGRNRSKARRSGSHLGGSSGKSSNPVEGGRGSPVCSAACGAQAAVTPPASVDGHAGSPVCTAACGAQAAGPPPASVEDHGGSPVCTAACGAQAAVPPPASVEGHAKSPVHTAVEGPSGAQMSIPPPHMPQGGTPAGPQRGDAERGAAAPCETGVPSPLPVGGKSSQERQPRATKRSSQSQEDRPSSRGDSVGGREAGPEAGIKTVTAAGMGPPVAKQGVSRDSSSGPQRPSGAPVPSPVAPGVLLFEGQVEGNVSSAPKSKKPRRNEAAMLLEAAVPSGVVRNAPIDPSLEPRGKPFSSPRKPPPASPGTKAFVRAPCGRPVHDRKVPVNDKHRTSTHGPRVENPVNKRPVQRPVVLSQPLQLDVLAKPQHSPDQAACPERSPGPRAFPQTAPREAGVTALVQQPNRQAGRDPAEGGTYKIPKPRMKSLLELSTEPAGAQSKQQQRSRLPSPTRPQKLQPNSARLVSLKAPQEGIQRGRPRMRQAGGHKGVPTSKVGTARTKTARAVGKALHLSPGSGLRKRKFVPSSLPRNQQSRARAKGSKRRSPRVATAAASRVAGSAINACARAKPMNEVVGTSKQGGWVPTATASRAAPLEGGVSKNLLARAVRAAAASAKHKVWERQDINAETWAAWALTRKLKGDNFRYYGSSIHGAGLFAARDVKKGEFVIEYVGALVPSNRQDMFEKKYLREGIKSTYMFSLDDDWIIDATKQGNAARYINHSCDPNCVAKLVHVKDGQNHVCIFARRDINYGEELAYNYQSKATDEATREECRCGAKNCVKWI